MLSAAELMVIFAFAIQFNGPEGNFVKFCENNDYCKTPPMITKVEMTQYLATATIGKEEVKVAASLNMSTPLGKSVLVHEYRHRLQMRAKHAFKNPNNQCLRQRMEHDAEQAQEAYLMLNHKQQIRYPTKFRPSEAWGKECDKLVDAKLFKETRNKNWKP